MNFIFENKLALIVMIMLVRLKIKLNSYSD